MDADIVGLQEVFEEAALRDVIDEADTRGAMLNDAALPDATKSYRKKAIFRKLAYEGYRDAAIAFAPNLNDGEPGQRRPGLALLSRFGFAEPPEVIQQLDQPLVVPLQELGGG